MTTAYPLHWPPGWPRIDPRKQHSSRLTTGADQAVRKLRDELRLLGAKNLVISSNLPTRQDGQPYVARRKIDDAAVAIYFELNGKPMAMARDAYWTVHENIMSLAHAVAHMRGLSRHGGNHMMQQAFTGFVALPAPGAQRPWWEVLNPRCIYGQGQALAS
jgi:hypothetical protein